MENGLYKQGRLLGYPTDYKKQCSLFLAINHRENMLQTQETLSLVCGILVFL